MDLVSTGTSGAPTNPVDPQKQVLEALTQSLLKRAQAPQAGGMQQPIPRASQEQLTPQGYNMQQGKSRGEEAGIAMQNFGTMIHNLVAQHKQNQIRDAMSEWQGFNHSLENAQALAGDPSAPDYQQKVQQYLAQDPWVKTNLDPANPKAVKRLKNMYKALNVDLLAGDKDNVHREGLKRFFQVNKALQRVKQIGQQKQQQSQMTPEQKQQMFQQSMAKLMGQQTIQKPDPKMIEEAAKLQAATIEHQDALAFQKQAHLDSLNMQMESLKTRQLQMQEMEQSRQFNLQERVRHDRETEDLRRQMIQIRADKAQTTGDVSGLKTEVEKGFPIDKLDTKSRVAVVKAFADAGLPTPKPFSPQEQTAMDDASAQLGKIRGWEDILKDTAQNKELSNKPLGSFWDSLKYKVGLNTPESAMISDFSRERWAAIGGLVRGVRRGDILKSMVQHTPDPWKDSPRLMLTKLKALEANYEIARATALKEHQFTKDPETGENLDDQIKSYTDHLKLYTSDAQRLSQPAPKDNKVYGKGSVPE